LSELTQREREEFLLILEKIKPTFNEQREILETLLDFKRRENFSNLLPPELKNILEEEETNLRRKSFLNFMEKIKYPTYSVKREKIKKIRETLAERGIRLEYTPFLEKKEVFLQIKCRDLEELREKISLLERYGEGIFRIFE
ncbi:MAG: hypothetical protein ACK4K4_05385, partial [Caldimicrobium sp.]